MYKPIISGVPIAVLGPTAVGNSEILTICPFRCEIAGNPETMRLILRRATMRDTSRSKFAVESGVGVWAHPVGGKKHGFVRSA
jgi:hypothetical protein